MFIDLAKLEAITNNNSDLRDEVIDYYLGTTPSNLEKLQKEIRSSRWDVVAGLAHEMLTTISIVGIDQMKKNLEIIEENALEQQQLNAIPELLQDLEILFGCSCEELRSKRIKV